mmetsp:Transcript_15501/g.11281  ORF Transcript_15501/g.11281 Transcript_15501/m.11281 type:complete len:84 (+) Transcript_15501:216-467(+)
MKKRSSKRRKNKKVMEVQMDNSGNLTATQLNYCYNDNLEEREKEKKKIKERLMRAALKSTDKLAIVYETEENSDNENRGYLSN